MSSEQRVTQITRWWTSRGEVACPWAGWGRAERLPRREGLKPGSQGGVGLDQAGGTPLWCGKQRLQRCRVAGRRYGSGTRGWLQGDTSKEVTAGRWWEIWGDRVAKSLVRDQTWVLLSTSSFASFIPLADNFNLCAWG